MYERIRFDLKVIMSYTRIILSLFKGNLKQIYENPHQVESTCNLKTFKFKMFAMMIKNKFTDDDF